MPVEIKIPSVGESITEGIVSRWLKKDGEIVRADEPIFELETDKATAEVPSPAAGTLHIMAEEGRALPVGTVVGTIEESQGSAVKQQSPKESRVTAPSA